MIQQVTLDKLRSMRLSGFAAALEEQSESASYGALSFDERLGLLVDCEMTHREDRRLTRLLRNAKLKYRATVEEIDYRARRGLDRAAVRGLVQGEWLRSHQNLIVIGKTGTGKTFLACALANEACRQGYAAAYYRAPRLLHDLSVARADGTYQKLLLRLARTTLLIIDDWLIAPPAEQERRDLLEVLEDRYQVGSTLITTQLDIKHWHDTIGDPTLADAICDRLVHNAHRIAIKGGSMRKERSGLTEKAKASE
jgi:DNA replication protein DnaC